MISIAHRDLIWPSLPLAAWSDTCATLHLWTQIMGKIRLAQSPWINHSWHLNKVGDIDLTSLDASQ